ncbi:MAG TPA: YbhB/YbcL family Raf kinase inhibitor-like protein, partial [Nitrosopumilus sp.]|nr:YbhB/YbcL family Raf kinase inhibitor-like protein [Nitrosopumilus sp.]
MVFGWGKKKPIESTAERKSVNQNIELDDVPQNTKSLSIIMDDP